MAKQAAIINDISCYGRCSTLVACPVLAHYGVTAAPLPTVLLSTHTGGFDGYTFLDLSEEMKKIAAHWKSLGIKFDAISSGFLGSAEQIQTVSDFIDDFKGNNTPVLVDPVMGDNGIVYRTYTKEMCVLMRLLCEKADIITPNLTEAYILTGGEYNSQPSKAEQERLLSELCDILRGKSKTVVITGVLSEDKQNIGAVYRFENGETQYNGEAFSPCCDIYYHGCGDLFASMLLGRLLDGAVLKDAVGKTVEYISAVSAYTKQKGTPVREGVLFEEYGIR